jgi:hypothetical protein
VRINSTGISALEQLLSLDLFKLLQSNSAKVTSKSSIPQNFLDAITGEGIKLNYNGPPPPMPPKVEEIAPLNLDRTVFRSVLMTGLSPYIQFGKEFLSYTLTPHSAIVHFSDGSTVEGSLLIGADGSKSRVRKQFLPGHNLIDTEGWWIYGKTTISSELEKRLNGKVKEGLTLVQDKSKRHLANVVYGPSLFLWKWR